MNEETEKDIETYDEFDNIDGRKIGTKSRDAEIETVGKELFGFFLTLRREIRVNTSATMHGNSPTPHCFSHSLSLSHPSLSAPYLSVSETATITSCYGCFYRQLRTWNAFRVGIKFCSGVTSPNQILGSSLLSFRGGESERIAYLLIGQLSSLIRAKYDYF